MPIHDGSTKASNFQIKPYVIVYTGDGTGALGGPERGHGNGLERAFGRLRWTSWTSEGAHGRTGEPAYSAVMNQSDPTAVLAEMKRTEALLRDARSVLRRVDALAAKASTSDDPSHALIGEVRTAAEHLVSQLAHRQQTERRSAKQAARRLR